MSRQQGYCYRFIDRSSIDIIYYTTRDVLRCTTSRIKNSRHGACCQSSYRLSSITKIHQLVWESSIRSSLSNTCWQHDMFFWKKNLTIGSSVFFWNWTRRTRVTCSKGWMSPLAPPPPRPPPILLSGLASPSIAWLPYKPPIDVEPAMDEWLR